PAHAEQSYTVQPGDHLARIARSYGVDLNALATANNIVNPNLIFPGQVLIIPDSGAPAEEGTAPPAEESGESLPPPAVTEHIVQPGETLFRVALRYGVTVADLQQLNNLPNANLIYVGQRLLISQNGAALGEQPAPPPPAPVAAKRIVVDKSEQRAYVYENGNLLWTFVVSTGMPGSETWSGTFAVRSKIPEAYAYNWALRMPYWLGFYHTGYLENGFHALPIMSSGAILWDGYLGTPVSYGCVILSYPDATTLYNWAEIGTEVVVQP
ncbi:MAG: LysM peptidoglycan-binding domain-containing protein, partial [Chloroflexi bacterium]|nr:LysM peptidoglycan-binding domain-containing protein [Chloroflexota bacterium]